MENEKKEKSKVKKQVPLRLSKELYDEIAQWAEDEFRSMNGQIEYLLGMSFDIPVFNCILPHILLENTRRLF